MRGLFLKVWLICGTLVILYTAAIALVTGPGPLKMLRAVAAGPFGDAARDWGLPGSLLGLAVHYAIMAAMVAAGLWLARKTPLGAVSPWKAGTLFGLMLYGVMAGIVLQLRFDAEFPSPDKTKLALDLLPHIAFVGIPIFWFVRQAGNGAEP